MSDTGGTLMYRRARYLVVMHLLVTLTVASELGLALVEESIGRSIGFALALLLLLVLRDDLTKEPAQ